MSPYGLPQLRITTHLASLGCRSRRVDPVFSKRVTPDLCEGLKTPKQLSHITRLRILGESPSVRTVKGWTLCLRFFYLSLGVFSVHTPEVGYRHIYVQPRRGPNRRFCPSGVSRLLGARKPRRHLWSTKKEDVTSNPKIDTFSSGHSTSVRDF